MFMSLSPVLRRNVSELSGVTNVFSVERLVNVIKFFESVDVPQINSVLHCADANALYHLIGFSCPSETLRMMHILLSFLSNRYAVSQPFKSVI